jgi:uncharacterized protein (TIGR03435 family)
MGSAIAISILAALALSPLWSQVPAFDVASVRQNKSGSPPAGDTPYSNIPLGPGDVYSPTGGYFKAVNQPLILYLAFAYKIRGNQAQFLRDQLPKWAMTDGFDIQARVEGNPTKDQMRILMQSLLADRFKLAIHTETRQLPVYAFILAKPGKTGPHLQPHPAASQCSTETPATASQQLTEIAGGFPAVCGGIFGMPSHEAGSLRLGARNINIDLIVQGLGQLGQLGRPVLDRTGLTGTFDFAFEWRPESVRPVQPGNDLDPGLQAPTFLDALKDQLGLKVESQKGPVEVLAVDHVERPSEN